VTSKYQVHEHNASKSTEPETFVQNSMYSKLEAPKTLRGGAGHHLNPP